MKLTELRKVNDLLIDFWDFFYSNSDSDETGLVEEYSTKYEMVKKIIDNEFYKIHLRNAKKKIKRDRKNKLQN